MALAAEQSVELYNKLIALDPESDLAAIKQVAWRLRSLDRKGFDVATRVALLIGLMRLGERQEADQVMEVLPPTRLQWNPANASPLATFWQKWPASSKAPK